MYQAKWWIGTLKYNPTQDLYPVDIGDLVDYVRGQLELGTTGYMHWQFVVHVKTKCTLNRLKQCFIDQAVHLEPTRSKAALEYVWKEDTKVEGSEFEFGRRPVNRSNKKDWDEIWEFAIQKKILDIPPDIRIRSYSTINRIGEDYQPAPWRHDILVQCYWGSTGTGKTQKAWTEAPRAYIKDAHTKWWDAYRCEEDVIIDDFTGNIGIGRLLQWFDRYPCRVEKKGSTSALFATRFWITSNINPREWFKDANEENIKALLRRMKITHFNKELGNYILLSTSVSVVLCGSSTKARPPTDFFRAGGSGGKAPRQNFRTRK